jgi:hypothetical protein
LGNAAIDGSLLAKFFDAAIDRCLHTKFFDPCLDCSFHFYVLDLRSGIGIPLDRGRLNLSPTNFANHHKVRLGIQVAPSDCGLALPRGSLGRWIPPEHQTST